MSRAANFGQDVGMRVTSSVGGAESVRFIAKYRKISVLHRTLALSQTHRVFTSLSLC